VILHFDELQSTNSYLKGHLDGLPQYAVVVADNQTAGRGQRGNSWESEHGKNILMSMLYYPPASLHPSCQFQISKAVSLAVAEVVDQLIGGADAPEVCIKWPNDIYVGDRKVAGILIENSLQSSASIACSVIGIGLNLNQRLFRSDAPNPASVISFTDREFPLQEATVMLRDSLASYLSSLVENGRILDSSYHSRLWRRSGFHPYVALTPSSSPAPTAMRNVPSAASSSIFEAEIVEVAADGPLILRLRSGELRKFHFKEITPVL